MTRYNFKFTDKRASGSEAFSEASEAELKVLVALLECGGVSDDEELLRICGVSRSRLAAAIALWQGEGVIEERGEEVEEGISETVTKTPYGNKVEEEFEERIFANQLYEETAIETANTIRNKNLASLMDECAKLMGKHMLSPLETKRIASLSMQYGLSEEYIAILASHLAEKGNLTVTMLINKAIKLSESDITTVDELDAYISEKERECGDFAELRRLLGIYDRRLSPTEEKHFRRWLYDFYFDTEMIAVSYDYTVNNTGKRSISYMDKLISDWHSAGCKSAAACRDRYEQVRAEQNKAAAEKKTAGTARVGYSKPEREKPRYGNFDPEEAFRIALARSFPEDENDKES